MNQFLKNIIAASALVVATAASATEVKVIVNDNLNSGSASGQFRLEGYKNDAWTNVTAGEFTAKISSGGASFAAYCYDMEVTMDAVGFYDITTPQLADVALLFAAAGFDGGKWNADSVTGYETAALQLAIWEVKYDGLDGFNFDAGKVEFRSFSSAVTNLAKGFANQANILKASGYTSANVRLFTSAVDALGNPTTQALVTTVPEPSTYALMAACLGVVGFVARRKKSV